MKGIVFVIFVLLCSCHELAWSQGYWPISNSNGFMADTITSTYSIRRDNSGNYNHHSGIDIRAADDTPIHGTIQAVLRRRATTSNGAVYVVYNHESDWDAGSSLYMHLSSYIDTISEGDTVPQGEIILYSGHSGDVPPHLHYGYFGDNEAYELAPRCHPLTLLPFINSTCPDVYCNGGLEIYPTASGAIDRLVFSTCTPSTELDFSQLSIWLYDGVGTAHSKRYNFTTQDTQPISDTQYPEYTKDSNVAFWAQNGTTIGEYTFTTEGNSDFEVTVRVYANEYNVGDDDQIINWEVDPVNNTLFQDFRWIGISAYDVWTENGECNDYSYWGNISGYGPATLIENFRVEADSSSTVRVMWTGLSSDLLSGIVIFRSSDSLAGYNEVSSTLAAAAGDNTYIDKGIPPGRHYYKYRLYFTDGNTSWSPGYRSVVTAQPRTFSLSQNYPNPFNPSTSIDFSISKRQEGQIDLTVYNILGQKVKMIASGNFVDGTYSVVWNGDSDNGGRVASGVYYYKLSTKAGSLTRKLVLLK